MISAVGHETDVTIADLVADWRAATPSAAAECAVPDRAAVARQISTLSDRMKGGLGRWIASRSRRLEQSRDAIEFAGRYVTRSRRETVGQLAERLDALSPLGAMRRGFAVPLDQTGTILRTVDRFEPGTSFRLRVVDGTVPCTVDGKPVPAASPRTDDMTVSDDEISSDAHGRP